MVLVAPSVCIRQFDKAWYCFPWLKRGKIALIFIFRNKVQVTAAVGNVVLEMIVFRKINLYILLKIFT